MFDTCTLAVFAEMKSASAIWRLVRPFRHQRDDVELAGSQAEAIGR